MELFIGGVKRYSNNAVELLHCNNFDINTIRGNLKKVISCKKMVQETCIRMLGSPPSVNRRLVKKGEYSSVCFVLEKSD